MEIKGIVNSKVPKGAAAAVVVANGTAQDLRRAPW